jgi:hypothetical protein
MVRDTGQKTSQTNRRTNTDMKQEKVHGLFIIKVSTNSFGDDSNKRNTQQKGMNP